MALICSRGSLALEEQITVLVYVELEIMSARQIPINVCIQASVEIPIEYNLIFKLRVKIQHIIICLLKSPRKRVEYVDWSY